MGTNTAPDSDPLATNFGRPGVDPEFNRIGEPEPEVSDGGVVVDETPSADDPGQGDGGGGATTTAPAPSQDSELERVLAAKGWQSPEDLARAYAQLEQRLGQQGDELGKTRQQMEQERQQFLDALAKASAQQAPVPTPVAPEPDPVSGIDWGRLAAAYGEEAEFGETLGAIMGQVLPEIVAHGVKQQVAPIMEQLAPLQQQLATQENIRQVNAALDYARENDPAFAIAGERAIEILNEWNAQGVQIDPAVHVDAAIGVALREAVRDEAARAAVPDPVAPAPVVPAPPVVPVAPATQVVTAAEITPPVGGQSSAGAVAGAVDPADELRAQIMAADPPHNDGL